MEDKFLNDPKPEYIDFVENEIDERLTGEDEYYIVKALIEKYR